MQTRLLRLLLQVAPASILLVLGSCGPEKGKFAPACPVPGLLKPLVELARYRGDSKDFRNLIIRARIVDIVGKCMPGDNADTVVTTVQVVVDATRGPAMAGNVVGLPVFVAITEGDAIGDKALFSLVVEFPSNVDTTRVASKEIRMEIPVTPQKSAAAYTLVAGFQLAPAEVAQWRRDNPH
jgi:hypothetical protein